MHGGARCFSLTPRVGHESVHEGRRSSTALLTSLLPGLAQPPWLGLSAVLLAWGLHMQRVQPSAHVVFIPRLFTKGKRRHVLLKLLLPSYSTLLCLPLDDEHTLYEKKIAVCFLLNGRLCMILKGCV